MRREMPLSSSNIVYANRIAPSTYAIEVVVVTQSTCSGRVQNFDGIKGIEEKSELWVCRSGWNYGLLWVPCSGAAGGVCSKKAEMTNKVSDFPRSDLCFLRTLFYNLRVFCFLVSAFSMFYGLRVLQAPRPACSSCPSIIRALNKAQRWMLDVSTHIPTLPSMSALELVIWVIANSSACLPKLIVDIFPEGFTHPRTKWDFNKR